MSPRSTLAKVLFTSLTAVLPLISAAGPTKPAGQRFWTYPMPSRPSPVDPLQHSPHLEVPQSPERFTWKLTAPRVGPKTSEVPVYLFGDDGRRRPVGTLPLGTVVKIERFRVFGHEHYYAVPWQDGEGWVRGSFLAASAPSAPDQ